MLPCSHTVSTHEARTQFRAGVIACLPTVTGYWSIGFAAGAMGTLSGFSLLHTGLLAAFLYAGSAQFLFYSLWAAGADIASVIVSVVLVNLRYLLMSSALSLGFREHTLGQKIISGLLLTDETFGVAAQHSAHHGTIPFYWMAGLNLTAWINWIIACLVGAWLASTIPASVMEGLSFSLVSMFIGLVLMTWFASQQKGLETLTIIAAIVLTLCSADYLSISLLVVFAAAISATLATLVLRLTAPQRKQDDI